MRHRLISREFSKSIRKVSSGFVCVCVRARPFCFCSLQWTVVDAQQHNNQYKSRSRLPNDFELAKTAAGERESKSPFYPLYLFLFLLLLLLFLFPKFVCTRSSTARFAGVKKKHWKKKDQPLFNLAFG